MINRVLTISLIAGIVAGLCVSVLQMGKVIPLILEAETYETASIETTHPSHEAAEEWAPTDGLERTLYTVLSNVITGVGFALLLSAAIVLRGRSINVKEGILWGIGGFLTFSLFPSFGLPPELPGVDAASLELRQIWWVLTAICTAIGLSLIVFKPKIAWKSVGLVLLLLPHIAGAPHLSEPGGNAPAALAAEFAVASLVTSAFFWLIIGGTSGWCFNRMQLQK